MRVRITDKYVYNTRTGSLAFCFTCKCGKARVKATLCKACKASKGA